MKTRIVLVIVSVMLISHMSMAVTEDKLLTKLRLEFPGGISASLLADYDLDGKTDIIVSDNNNTIFIYETDGSLKYNFSIGNVNDTGVIRVIDLIDVDSDGQDEWVIATANLRELIEYPRDEYYRSGNRVKRYSRVLYKTLRNKGSVRVYEKDLSVNWIFESETSVQDVVAINLDSDDSLEYLVGIGDFSIDEWWVMGAAYPDGRENWTLLEYVTKNGSITLLDDSGDVIWDFNITQDEIIVEDNPGVYTFNLIPLKTSDGQKVYDAKVRTVFAADLYDIGQNMLLAGSDNGYIYVLNNYILNHTKSINWTFYVGSDIYFLSAADLEGDSNLEIVVGTSDNTLYVLSSRGALLWKYRFPAEPKSVAIADVDNDGNVEILVGNRDGYLYAFYGDGKLKWKQYLAEPTYNILVGDVDNDSLADILLDSAKNATLYEMSAFYVKKEEADYYYRIAEEEYDAGDYTLAIIYLDRAGELYNDISDPSGIPKINLLIEKIQIALESDKKRIADFNYNRALDLYGLSKYNESLVYIAAAKEIYLDINDSTSVEKCNSLVYRIRAEQQDTKKFTANSKYTIALSLYNFRNYSGAYDLLSEAKTIYKEVGDYTGIDKSNVLLTDIAVAYSDSAKRQYISLDYDAALESAKIAKNIFSEVGNASAAADTAEFILDVEAGRLKETSPIMEFVGKALPAILAVLIVLLLISIFRKSGGGGFKSKDEGTETSDSVFDEFKEELDL